HFRGTRCLPAPARLHSAAVDRLGEGDQMPLAAPLILGASSVGGGLISGLFGKSAADTQAQAAEQAAQLEAQEQDKALAFQQQVWGQQQANEAPYLQAGKGALTTL